MQQCKIAAIIVLTVWNIFVFLLYGADKHKAKCKRRRISERTLIISAFCMGGLGAILGMKCFHHKTKHSKFKTLVPLALICNIAVIISMLYTIYQKG